MAEAERRAGFAGRVCAVTGGGAGIGRRIALALAAQDAVVAVLDRDEAAARATLDLVVQGGGHGVAVACDVADQHSVEAAGRAVQGSLGDTDVLVNNAAIRRPGPIETLSLADWNALLSVNLTGYFLCSQVFGRGMLAKGAGALVHVASQAADFAHPFSGAYSVAKAGVTMFSRLLAVEWGPGGVRSNAVLPGFVNTGQPFYDQPDAVGQRSAAVPSGRIGRADDTAEAVLFLAGPHSTYINGAELTVDGGFTRNLMNLVPGPGRPASPTASGRAAPGRTALSGVSAVPGADKP